MTDTLHFAPAKINLFLHILGQKPNGYHRLQTIFQRLDFGDFLTFELIASPHVELIAPNCSFNVEENLVTRAAKLLQAHLPAPRGARITLDKRIPMGAGLGGGSSDAGTTLRVLNQLWSVNLPLPQLMALGETLGADVPLFVLNQNAWGEGIGEQLTPMTLPMQTYVILQPNVHVDTKTLFQHPDLPRHTPEIPFNNYAFEKTHNDFEDLVCRLYPDIAEARTWLNQFGPARLTGSGACLFLAVENKMVGEKIKAQLPKAWNMMVCESLG